MTFTQIALDTSGLASDRRFIADIVRVRVEERIKQSAEGATLSVSFTLDPALTGERAHISVKGTIAHIRAARFRSLLAGAGMLLRAVRWSEKSFELSDCDLDFAPESPLRQAYFARHFNNWYHRASNAELGRYIEDLALWGMNSIHNLLLPVVNYDDDFETNPEALECFEKFRESERMVHRLDMIFGSGLFANQSFKNTPEEFRAVPNSDLIFRGNRGVNICPEKPGAMDYLLTNARKILERVRGTPIDIFRFWPYDEGGCECKICRPWGGHGYLKVISAIKDVILEYYPAAKFMVSTWTFQGEEWPLFYDFLKKNNWINMVVADSHTSEFPGYPLENPLPKQIPLITFPEISMWHRWPWGGYGSIPLAAHFSDMFHQVKGHVSGFTLYSEGIYEDVNKIIVSEFYRDPETDAEDTLRAYCRYEFPGADAEDFVKLCRLLEANQLAPFDEDFLRMHRDDAFAARAEDALRIAQKMDAEILPSMRGRWRWRMVFLRAVIDNEFKSGKLRTDVSMAAFREIIEIDHAEMTAGEFKDENHKNIRPPMN